MDMFFGWLRRDSRLPGGPVDLDLAVRTTDVSDLPGTIREVFRKGRNSAPLRVSTVYAVVGAAWLLIEHNLLGGPAIYKDFFFLFATTWMLYWLVSHGLSRIQRSEEALRVSEEHLQNILESNPCGVLLIDEDRILTFVNSAAAEILGVEQGRMLGRSYESFKDRWEFSTTDGTRIPSKDLPWERVLRSGETLRDLEFSIKHPGGDRMVLSVNSAPLQSPDGRIIGAVSSFFDISERRKEEFLTLQKLFLAAQQSPITVMITDTDLRVEYVNPAHGRMTGYLPEEVLGERVHTLFHGTPDIFGEIVTALREGVRWSGIHQSTRKDGELLWESVGVSSIRDQEGKISHFLWVREDITEKHQVEKELRESEERFRQIFVQNEEPVLIFRADSTEVLDANPAAIELYGFPLEMLKEDGPILFLLPGELDRFAGWVCGIRSDRPLSVDMTTQVKRDGSRILVSIRGKTIRLRDGIVSYCTFRDITSRIEAEEAAKSRQAQLIHASRMASMGTMVSGVAHEINNPNNLIMFNAPMLRAVWSDSEKILSRRFEEEGEFPIGGVPYSEMRGIIPQLFDGISEASQRIKNIVANLKDYSRQEKGEVECLINVNEVVQAAIGIINHQILKGTRNFRVEYGSPPPRVDGYAQQLEQVVINLVLNALTSLPGPGSGVRVATVARRETGRVEIVVEDEGHGMSKEVIERVTEPFFTTRTENGGLGLGLSLSSAIVQDHKGEMVFESEVGKGTTVRVILPASEGVPVEEEAVSIPDES